MHAAELKSALARPMSSVTGRKQGCLHRKHDPDILVMLPLEGVRKANGWRFVGRNELESGPAALGTEILVFS